MRAFGAALSARGARRFFFAHAQSSLGSGIAIVGLPLLAYDRYHTAWALTAVLLCELLPAVLLGPLLGALADRLPRRTALVAADVLRLGAFGALVFVPSLTLMIACALVAGIGSALFNPSALASVSRLATPPNRPAAMSLYSALDDIGLTLGPALAGALLLIVEPHILMAINAGTFTLSAGLLATIPLSAPARRPVGSLISSMRSGARQIVALPGVRLLLASSTVAVVAVGMVNVGEVLLARELLGVGGAGLAALMTASGIGTFVGSTFGARTGTSWQWRRAYLAGLMCMAADLVLCAIAPYFWLLVITFALGGFGNGLALVHDRLLLAHTVPEALHGRLFALHKTCTSAAFVVAFVLAGVLITTLGIQAMFLCGGLALTVIILIVRPPLRALWPEPSVEPDPPAQLHPQPSTT
ncbi:MAG TPA: MFS transporter [Solirubrobacteraceae bacterium]|nr:MFS transporter [Solirubrobacteraceae bacterium]